LTQPNVGRGKDPVRGSLYQTRHDGTHDNVLASRFTSFPCSLPAYMRACRRQPLRASNDDPQ